MRGPMKSRTAGDRGRGEPGLRGPRARPCSWDRLLSPDPCGSHLRAGSPRAPAGHPEGGLRYGSWTVGAGSSSLPCRSARSWRRSTAASSTSRSRRSSRRSGSTSPPSSGSSSGTCSSSVPCCCPSAASARCSRSSACTSRGSPSSPSRARSAAPRRARRLGHGCRMDGGS